MKINPALFWFLLSVAMFLGCMLAGLLRAKLIGELEYENLLLRNDKRRLAEDLAKAVNHPSVRSVRRLSVVGQRQGSDQ